MGAKPILCTASVLQMETLGPDLAAAKTGSSNAYAVALGLSPPDAIAGDAQARAPVQGRRACLFGRTGCQAFRLRKRSWRRQSIWLPGRVRLFRRVEPGCGTHVPLAPGLAVEKKGKRRWKATRR